MFELQSFELLYFNLLYYITLDERPDLSTAELKLKSQVQLKSKKKNRLKSRNSSLSKSTDEEKEPCEREEEEKDAVTTAINALTNIVITTAAQFVSSIKWVSFSVTIIARNVSLSKLF